MIDANFINSLLLFAHELYTSAQISQGSIKIIFVNFDKLDQTFQNLSKGIVGQVDPHLRNQWCSLGKEAIGGQPLLREALCVRPVLEKLEGQGVFGLRGIAGEILHQAALVHACLPVGVCRAVFSRHSLPLPRLSPVMRQPLPRCRLPGGRPGTFTLQLLDQT